MFEYFRDNYAWNLAVCLAMGCGGEISEVDDACQPLISHAGLNDARAQEAWIQSWTKLGETVQARAEAEAAAGWNLSAGRKLRRAAIYLLIGERMFHGASARRNDLYLKAIEVFRRSAELAGEGLAFVDVPYGDAKLKAIFKPASARTAPAPCIIHFGGFDVLKEIVFASGVPDALARRGIASLVVDHPGIGYALRIDGMCSLPEMERPAGACVDYLEHRSDVDRSKIGIMAQSMGGYYAPRAAAFEKRLACCVAWGAMFDYGPIARSRVAGLDTSQRSVSGWEEHAKWVFGVQHIQDILPITDRMTLAGVAENITCPLLVTHGENDRQIPLSDAKKTFEAAVNSPNRHLKTFSLSEGGAEHCQVDNWSLAADYMSDWVAETIGTHAKERKAA